MGRVLHGKIVVDSSTKSAGCHFGINVGKLRLGEEKKERRKKIEITGQKYNGLPYYIGRP